MKKIVYIDMDGVLVDSQTAIGKLNSKTIFEYDGRIDEVPGIFSLMEPMKGAIKAFELISKHFDTYVLSTAPWNNPSSWSDKLLWVQKYLGDFAHKRLILTHHKNLNIGDYLIDDRRKRGADKFQGELILFGSDEFPDWDAVLEYLFSENGIDFPK